MKVFIVTLSLSLMCVMAFSQSAVSFISINNISPVIPSIKFNALGIADGIIKVKMFDQPEGVYTVRVMDSKGNVLGVKTIGHSNGSKIEIVDLGRTFAGGTYKLEVISPDQTKTDETIMLLL